MIKEFLYDWCGFNKIIFLKLNATFTNNVYDQVMMLIDIACGYKNFAYHLILLLMLCLTHLYNTKDNFPKLKNKTLEWLELFATLSISLAITYAITMSAKIYLQFERPYCTTDLGKIHLIKDILKEVSCNHSFPSGHVAFATVFIASIWHMSNKYIKFISCIVIPFVAISRIAAGAHFPADLIGSFMICLITTTMIKKIIHIFIRKYFNFYVVLLPWLKNNNS